MQNFGFVTVLLEMNLRLGDLKNEKMVKTIHF